MSKRTVKSRLVPRLVKITAAVKLNAAAGEGSPTPRFEMVAYTGGELFIDGFAHPVIVDYAGLVHGQELPVLAGHETSETLAVIGQSDRVAIESGELLVSGRILAKTATATHVVDMAKNGYQWQCSIGSLTLQQETIPAGREVEVNGQTFAGPVVVSRRTLLREISFVPVGGDLSTSVLIAARAAQMQGSIKMSFEEWAAQKGIEIAGLSEDELAALREEYEVEQASVDAEGEVDDEEEPVNAEGETDEDPDAVNADAGGDTPDFATWLMSLGFDQESLSDQQKAAMQLQYKAQYPGGVEARARLNLQARQRRQRLQANQRRGMAGARTPVARTPMQQLRASAARESRRIAQINAKCKKHPTIAAKAIEAGWSPEKAELAVLRAERPKAPAAHIRQTDTSPTVLEAAICLHGGLSNIEKSYSEKTLEAASRQYKGGVSLKRVLLEAAWQAGCSDRFLTATSCRRVLEAAFSTASLPGILSNTANKFLLQGYQTVDQSWTKISAVGSVADFKTTTRYRMTTGGDFELVPATGKLKHGTLGEETYTNKADTYGKMYGISRTMMINDDLGALNDMPREIGRKAGLKLNKVFWTAFMNNALFFTVGNKNYFEGAATLLQFSSLQTAVKMFRDQVDPNKDPLGIEPKLLLVSSGNTVTAEELYVSTNLNTGGSSTKDKVPNSNVFRGKYIPVPCPYLNNSNFPGYSDLAWYLLADPADLPVIEVVFLDGQQQPTVETADASFDTLGIEMRGFFDFGVNLQDHRGGVKSKGQA